MPPLDPPLKVCLLSSCYALSEEDRHASFLVESNKYLRERGVDVSVFAPSYKGLASHTVDGIEVHRFRYCFRRWENLTHMEGAPTRVRNPLYLLVAVSYILSGLVKSVWYCWGKKFDVIHVHWPFPHAIWGYAASRLTGARMVLTFHGAEVLLCKKFFFVKYFLRHAIKHSDAVICNSSFTAARVRELGVDRPIEVIPFGTTLNVHRVEKNLDKPVKDVLFAGRLIERKGVEYLLRAAPGVLQQTPAHFHIVGTGDIQPELERLAGELGISDHVTFHGFVTNEELGRHYREADAFVLPAIVDDRGDTEGLGVVLVEAISHLTPVVASEVGGIVDVIKHEETGLLVEERNPAALATAIGRVLEDRPLRTKIVEQGLAHAEDYLSWRRITDRLMQVYTKAARRRRGLDEAPASFEAAPAVDGAPAAAQAKVSWAKFSVRVLLSVAILAALFTQISPSEVLKNFERVSPEFVLFAWGYYALCQWISSYRWQLLLAAKNVHVTLSQLFSYYMIGMFVNNFMPGSVGGDVVKSYHLFRRTKEMEIAVVSVFLERFTGLIGLSIVSIIGLFIGSSHLMTPLVWGSVVGAVAILALMIVALWMLPAFLQRFPWFTRVVPAKVRGVAGGIYEALVSYRHEMPTVWGTIAISVVLQLMFAAYYYFASVAMGIPIDFIYFVLFLPMVTLVSLVPFSFGGLGVREAVMVALFSGVGVAKADVLSVSLTVHFINTLLSFWGGLLLLRRPAAAAPKAA